MSGTLAEFIDEKAKAKRSVRVRALAVVAIVAILLLSTLSLYFYFKMDDYRDSVYRSQYGILRDLETGTSLAGELIPICIDANYSIGERIDEAQYAGSNLDMAESASINIERMYHGNSEVSDAFNRVLSALVAVDGLLSSYSHLLSLNVSTNLPPLEAKLASLSPILTELSDAVAAGFREPGDIEEIPYSVVAGLDLELISDLSEAILQLFE